MDACVFVIVKPRLPVVLASSFCFVGESGTTGTNIVGLFIQLERHAIKLLQVPTKHCQQRLANE